MVLPNGAPQTQTQSQLLGESPTVTINVQNVGTTVGYQPFIDIFFPSNFSIANSNASIVRFLDYVSFSIYGVYIGNFDYRITTFPLRYGVNNTVIPVVCLADPFFDLSNGSKSLVCGKPGDLWLSVLLPVLLLGPTSPVLPITLSMRMRGDATIGQPLPVYYRTGFWAGSDPALNPTSDPSIVINTSPLPVEWTFTEGVSYFLPSPFTVSLSFSSGKFATGPSFPQTATLTMSIAKSVLLDNVTISTVVPASFFVSATSALPTPTTIQKPVFAIADNDRTLMLKYSSLLGTAGTDVRSTISFYVPQFNSSSAYILDPQTGAPREERQVASVVAYFTSPTTGSRVSFLVSSGTAVTSLRSILITKSMSIASDWSKNILSPHDMVLHDLSVQVSDYFSFGWVMIHDLISDGQTYNNSITPTLKIKYGNSFNTSVFTEGFDLYVNDTAPETYMVFNVSNLLPLHYYTFANSTIDNSTINNSTIIRKSTINSNSAIGSNSTIDSNSTININSTINSNSTINNSTTTQPPPELQIRTLNVLAGPVVYCHITYETAALVDYRDRARFPSNVNQGDWIRDDAILEASVIDPGVLLALGAPPDDSASAKMQMNIMPQSLKLTLYALDGVLCSPNPCQTSLLTPGTNTTYRIVYTHPSTDFTGYSLSVVDPSHRNDVTVFAPDVSGIPMPGSSCYGPTDTYHTVPPTDNKAPVVVSSSYPLMFEYQDNREPGAFPSYVDLLYTVTIDDTPYRGIFFNYLSIAKSIENSIGGSSAWFIKVRTPYPTITKGAILSTGWQTAYSIEPPFSWVYYYDLSQCPVIIDSVITADSANFDSDISNVYGGDVVTFMLTVTNTGTGDVFGLSVKDNIPSGFVVPPDGINLCAWRGDRTVIPLKGINTTDLFNEGITFPDFNSQQGVISAGIKSLNPTVSASGGENVMFITYNLMVDWQNMESGTNTGSSAYITRYGANLGGKDFVKSLDLVISDPIAIAFASANVSLWLSTTSISQTDWNALGNYYTDLAIGEVASFYASMIFPYGKTSKSVLQVTFPTGFQPINGSVYYTGGVVSNLKEGDLGTISNNVITFNLGTALNDPAQWGGYFMTEVYGVTQNVVANTAGSILNVTASVTTLARPNPVWDYMAVDLVEPAWTLTQSVSPNTNLQAGSTLTYTLVLSSPISSSGPAFNLSIQDYAPDWVSFNSATVSPGNTGGSLTRSSNLVSFFVPVLARGAGSITITISCSISTSATVGITLNNTVAGSYLSSPIQWVASTVRTYALGPNTLLTPLNKPTMTWAISSTSLVNTTNPAVTIGETATYTVTIVIPAGQSIFYLAVSLPNTAAAGYMGVLSSQVVSVTGITGFSSQVGTNGTATDASPVDGYSEFLLFDFKTNPVASAPNGTVVVSFVAVVPNVTANVRGLAIKPNAVLTYGNSTNNFTLSGSPSTLTIVEPSFAAATRTANSTSVNGADVILYTVSIAWSSITNDGPTYNFTVTDVLSPYVSLVVGSVSASYVFSGVTIPLTVSIGNIVGDTTISVISSPGVALYRYTGSLTVKYSVLVNPTVPAGTSIATTANLFWWSAPDLISPRRYTTTASTTITTKTPTITSFTYFNSSILPMTSGRSRAGYNDMTVGQTVTLRSTITLPIALSNLTLVLVTIGSPTTTVVSISSSRIVSISNGITGSLLPLSDPGVLSKVNVGDTFLSKVTWTLGNLVTTTTLQTVVVEVVIFVNDLAANADYKIFQPKISQRPLVYALLHHQLRSG